MPEEFVINVANRVKQLPPYLFGRLNALKYGKRRNNIDVIDLGMGNPNDPTLQPIIQKLLPLQENTILLSCMILHIVELHLMVTSRRASYR